MYLASMDSYFSCRTAVISLLRSQMNTMWNYKADWCNSTTVNTPNPVFFFFPFCFPSLVKQTRKKHGIWKEVQTRRSNTELLEKIHQTILRSNEHQKFWIIDKEIMVWPRITTKAHLSCKLKKLLGNMDAMIHFPHDSVRYIICVLQSNK